MDGDASITVLIEYLELNVIEAKLEQREHCKFFEDATLSLIQQTINHTVKIPPLELRKTCLLMGRKGSSEESAITVSHFLMDKLDLPVLREGLSPSSKLPQDESLFMGRCNR